MALEKLGDSTLLVRGRDEPMYFRLVMVVRRGFIPPTFNLSGKAFRFARTFFEDAAGKVGAIPVSTPTAEGAVVVVDMRPSTTQSVMELKRRIERGFADWDITADNIEAFRITSGNLDAKRAPAERMAIAEQAEAAEAETRIVGRVARGFKVGLGSARLLIVGAFAIAAAVVVLPIVGPKLFDRFLKKR